MFGKLLLTALVIALALAIAREHRQDRDESAAPDRSEPTFGFPWSKALAFFAVLIVLSAAAATYVHHWNQVNTIVKVRVINSNTGEVSVYEAKRKDIGNQHFTTVNHREVTVSAIERVEVVEIP